MCESACCTPPRDITPLKFKMKRTIYCCFVEKDEAVPVTPLPDPGSPSLDPTSLAEVSIPPPVSPVPRVMPNRDPPASVEMASPDSQPESEPTVDKKGQKYAFCKEWLVQFP